VSPSCLPLLAHIPTWTHDSDPSNPPARHSAGAFAHYSYALHDAIDACDSPVIEVHISNVYAREEFRHKSVTARKAGGYIAGCGTLGYEVSTLRPPFLSATSQRLIPALVFATQLGLRTAIARVDEQLAAKAAKEAKE